MRFGDVQRRVLALAAAAMNITPSSAQNTTTPNSNTTAPALQQSTFITPEQSLAFAISIPTTSSTDIYFSLAVQAAFAWGAVGLGPTMANSLLLLLYANKAGTNVTLSPRLTTSHREPALYPALRVDALPGTGVDKGTLVFKGVCRNCRRWPGGSLDVTAPAQRAVFALASQGPAGSDDAEAPLAMHGDIGAFTLDMRAAAGANPDGRAPVLDAATTKASRGATLLWSATGKRDWKAAAHALVMLFCFVGLFPMGILIIRLGEWVRWHAVHQAFALCGVLAGFGLGIDVSLVYNRSRGFNSAHQVIGLMVVAAVLVQFCLGFFHHRAYKKTQAPTKLRPWHVWLGRVAVPLGVINGFLGFPFALASGYNYILAGLVLAIVPIMLFLLVWKTCFRRLLRKLKGESSAAAAAAEDENAPPPAYSAEPWRAAQTPGAHGHGAPAGGGLSIGLSELTKEGTRREGGRGAGGRRARGADLGPAQTPHEYV